MNRSIEDQLRKVPGTIGNYPTTSDVFGADALLQHSDILIAINQPAKYFLNIYGPEKLVVSKHHLAMHFLKTRNGENFLCFFEEQFKHMRIMETKTPSTQVINSRRPIASSAPAGSMLSTLNI